MTHVDQSPDVARDVVSQRQGGYCGACWTPVLAGELHHRQSRATLPGWCVCNVVLLHPRCHTQGTNVDSWAVHDHPARARLSGLIVPSWDDPRDVRLLIRWPWEGWVLLSCDGLAVSADNP